MKLTNLINWLSQPKYLWWTIFLYVLLMGFFVQLILLPYVFPSWHDGNGILEGVDGKKFHRIALNLSQEIEAQGWSAWNLLAEEQLVSGIAAIFYTLIYPMPWSVLPVNALLHATACLCVYFLMNHFVENQQNALIASLPFIFYPSNLLWNTQFHNENYTVPSVILILYGWIIFTKKGENKTLPYLIAISLIGIGSLFLGLVRSYILSGMVFLYIATAILLALYWLVTKTEKVELFKKMVFAFLGCLIMLSILFSIKNLESEKDYFVEDSIDPIEILNLDPLGSKNKKKWTYSEWIPDIIDEQLRKLAKRRTGFTKSWKDAGSSIDLEVRFTKASDMLTYVPRAMQIGIFSPFPNTWLKENSERATSQGMRLVSGIEMLFSYFCLLGLPVFIWMKRKSPSFWITFFVCASMLIIYAMIIPNIGALYRFRYPFFMPLICFGVAGWLLKNNKTT